MVSQLEIDYNNIIEKYKFESSNRIENISVILKKLITSFLKQAKHPAIYCNGVHTKMMMSDFMFELKTVKTLIDNGKNKGIQGFIVIKDTEIENYKVDSIIISSYKFRNEIKEQLKKNHSQVKYLDIYEELAKKGFLLSCEYYKRNRHPYISYSNICSLQQILRKNEIDNKNDLFFKLVNEYLKIKDIKNAIKKTEEWINTSPSNKNKSLLIDLKRLYDTVIDTAKSVNSDSTIMLCMDAMQKNSLSKRLMPKLYDYVQKKGYMFENMYSFSTSTFESLMPVFAEKDNINDGFGNKEEIKEDQCRFIKEAKAKGNKICIYGDVCHYIESADFKYSNTPLTICEKIWDFLIEASDGKKGFYYIHELYETHFSFPNPFIEDNFVAKGTAILFDFLEKNGGKLETDYIKQHNASINYLDEVLTPIIKSIKCSIIIFADHGTLLLEKKASLDDVKELDYSCSDQLIRIPFVIISPEQETGKDNNLMSLMSFNDIMISVLKHAKYVSTDKDYIKIARNKIYNPDFGCIYEKANRKQDLLGFEAFVFKDGKKLIVYDNGDTALYDKNEKLNNDSELKITLFNNVRKDVTILKGFDYLIFGTGLFYQNRKNNINPSDIVAFIDNDNGKQGKKLDGKLIISPKQINEYNYNNIVIMNKSSYTEIFNQLISLGITKDKIINYDTYLQNKLLAKYGKVLFPSDIDNDFSRFKEEINCISDISIKKLSLQKYKEKINQQLNEIDRLVNTRVSVIMPAYNGERFISKTIDSILNQTYRNFELIIVEDCSTDETYSKILEFNDYRITVLKNDKNMGIEYSTNRGFEIARGEYIALIDDDDIALPERLETQIKYLDEHPEIGLLGSRSIEIDENDNFLTLCDVPIKDPNLIKATLLFKHVNFTNASIMFRKDLLLKNNIKLREHSYGIQDFRFYIDCSKVCNLTSLDKPLIKHRIYSTSTTKKMMTQQKIERAKIYALTQQESLSSSGFNLSEDEYALINKIYIEDDDVKVDSVEELHKLYCVFKKIIHLGEEMNIDFLPALKAVCHERLMKTMYNFGFFDNLNLVFEKKE